MRIKKVSEYVLQNDGEHVNVVLEKAVKIWFMTFAINDLQTEAEVCNFKDIKL